MLEPSAEARIIRRRKTANHKCTVKRNRDKIRGERMGRVGNIRIRGRLVKVLRSEV